MIFPKLHISLERWKWNAEYGLWVSTHGNFKSKDKKDRKIKVNRDGYLSVKSPVTQRQVLAHRLVMMTWKPIDDYTNMTVDHLDHNKRNNSLRNLEWVTEEENQHRAAADFASEKAKKVKFVITNYTMEHFDLCCNGLYFTNTEDVLVYVKAYQGNYINLTQIDKVYKTLINAYNHKNPNYLESGYTKRFCNCDFSIIKRG